MRGKLQSKFKPLSFCFLMKNARLYILECKIGRLNCETLILNVCCGAYGTRTRDPMRDRHVF